MNKLKIATLAILAMFVFSGCSLKKNDNDIIKINDTVITKKEYQNAYDSVTSNNMFAQMGIDFKNDTNNVFALMMKEKVVSELIVKALLSEEMEKRNIKATKEELENAEKDVISRFGSKEQFLQLIKLNGVTYENFKKDLEEEIKMKKFVDSIAMVSIGESEAKKYYDENQDKFKYPQRVRASHILIAANAEQIKKQLKEEKKDITDNELFAQISEKMKELRAQAEKLQNQVKRAPSTFAKVAKENSQDTGSALRGGDLGFFAKDEMVEQFANAAFSLAPNTISEVIQTPYGYHIIMVTDRAEAGTTPFVKVKEEVKFYLETKEQIKVLKNLTDGLMKTAKIEYLDPEFKPSKDIQKQVKEEIKK